MPAFVCDGMLGTLCKLMRMCGFDTAYSNEGAAILVQARREDRTILTRNARFKQRKGVHYLTAPDPLEQLTAVIDAYDLRNNIMILSRCLECNAPLKPVAKPSVQDRVPYYTYRHFDEFSECPSCRKIFWKGSHYQRMIDRIATIVPAPDPGIGRE